MGRLITGASARGDWLEALADAIGKAKNALQTDFVAWRLHRVTGESGGFVGSNTVNITIDAATFRVPDLRPWPTTLGDDHFPWPWSPLTSTLAQVTAASGPDVDAELANLSEKRCREIAQGVAGDDRIPETRSLSVYLIRAISEVRMADGSTTEGVPLPPEFLFVLDVGYPSNIGVSVPWSPVMLGDPNFPDFSRARCVSVRGSSRRSLLGPAIASEILVGIYPDVSPDCARQALEAEGEKLKNVRVSGSLATATCKAFHEEEVCAQLPARLPNVVRYAEPNRLMRLIDLAWSVVRVS
jgi:hypothetical protein